MTAAGECLIDTTQPECASAWCDENRVERDVDYDGPLAPVSGSWSASVTDAEVRCEGHVNDIDVFNHEPMAAIRTYYSKLNRKVLLLYFMLPYVNNYVV